MKTVTTRARSLPVGSMRRRAVLLLALPLLAGCAAGIRTSVSEPVQPSGSIPVGALAVMPITMEMGSEGFRPEVTEGLLASLRTTFPGVALVGPGEVGARLAAGPSATDYAGLLSDFERTGVIESARLGRLTDALGVTHFLQIRAGYASEDFLEPGILDNHATYEGTRQQLVAVARLWGPGGAGPVWEAVARTRSQSGQFWRGRDPSELVGDLVASLVKRMPLGGGAFRGR